ncbi:hypothetical protein, partial [Escherichia coli]|uniref:hypothetical protein n=1 Tax=Escherichia coli TaxID=562 RepID=UPI001C4402F7
LSSRSPLRWRQFEARRRATSRWLAALNLEATQQQLGADADLCRAVLALTAGHPFANETLRKLLPPHGDALAWLDGHQAEVARQVLRPEHDPGRGAAAHVVDRHLRHAVDDPRHEAVDAVEH